MVFNALYSQSHSLDTVLPSFIVMNVVYFLFVFVLGHKCSCSGATCFAHGQCMWQRCISERMLLPQMAVKKLCRFLFFSQILNTLFIIASCFSTFIWQKSKSTDKWMKGRLFCNQVLHNLIDILSHLLGGGHNLATSDILSFTVLALVWFLP